MDKDQIELLINTVGNEVVEFLNEEIVFSSDSPEEVQAFFDLAKIDEALN